MIPRNITKDLIIKAIDKINLEGVPKGRESPKFIDNKIICIIFKIQLF